MLGACQRSTATTRCSPRASWALRCVGSARSSCSAQHACAHHDARSFPTDAPAACMCSPRRLLFPPQTRRLHALLDREIAMLGGDASRVVFGGASQGGMLALHVAMGYRSPLGALICLRTMLSTDHTTPAGGDHAKTPIFVFAGGRDTICPLHEQRASFSRLSVAGYTVESHLDRISIASRSGAHPPRRLHASAHHSAPPSHRWSGMSSRSSPTTPTASMSNGTSRTGSHVPRWPKGQSSPSKPQRSMPSDET